MLRAEDGAGHARGLVDYLGFRTGPVIEIADNFMGCQQKSGAQTGAFVGGNGGWYTTGTTNSSSGYGANLGYQGGGAEVLSLSGSRTSSDSIGLFNLAVYNALTTALAPFSGLDGTVTVFEWAFTFGAAYTNANLFMGIATGSALNTGFTLPVSGVQAGVRYSLSGGDTSLNLVAGTASTVANVPTGISLPGVEHADEMPTRDPPCGYSVRRHRSALHQWRADVDDDHPDRHDEHAVRVPVCPRVDGHGRRDQHVPAVLEDVRHAVGHAHGRRAFQRRVAATHRTRSR